MQTFGLGKLALALKHQRQVQHRGGNLRMFWAQEFAAHLENFAVKGLGLDKLALRPKYQR